MSTDFLFLFINVSSILVIYRRHSLALWSAFLSGISAWELGITQNPPRVGRAGDHYPSITLWPGLLDKLHPGALLPSCKSISNPTPVLPIHHNSYFLLSIPSSCAKPTACIRYLIQWYGVSVAFHYKDKLTLTALIAKDLCCLLSYTLSWPNTIYS